MGKRQETMSGSTKYFTFHWYVIKSLIENYIYGYLTGTFKSYPHSASSIPRIHPTRLYISCSDTASV